MWKYLKPLGFYPMLLVLYTLLDSLASHSHWMIGFGYVMFGGIFVIMLLADGFLYFHGNYLKRKMLAGYSDSTMVRTQAVISDFVRAYVQVFEQKGSEFAALGFTLVEERQVSSTLQNYQTFSRGYLHPDGYLGIVFQAFRDGVPLRDVETMIIGKYTEGWKTKVSDAPPQACYYVHRSPRWLWIFRPKQSVDLLFRMLQETQESLLRNLRVSLVPFTADDITQESIGNFSEYQARLLKRSGPSISVEATSYIRDPIYEWWGEYLQVTGMTACPSLTAFNSRPDPPKKRAKRDAPPLWSMALNISLATATLIFYIWTQQQR